MSRNTINLFNLFINYRYVRVMLLERIEASIYLSRHVYVYIEREVKKKRKR